MVSSPQVTYAGHNTEVPWLVVYVSAPSDNLLFENTILMKAKTVRWIC